MYILRIANRKNGLDFIDDIEPTRILQKDRNSLDSVRENNTYLIQRRERKKLTVKG